MKRSGARRNPHDEGEDPPSLQGLETYGPKLDRRPRRRQTQSSSSASSATPAGRGHSRQQTPSRQDTSTENESARHSAETQGALSPASALLEISSSSSEENAEGHPNRKVAIEKLPHSRPPKPRKRVVQACNECRMRKTRCTGEEPRCSLCVQHGRECTYADTEAQLAKKDVAKAKEKLEQDVQRYRAMVSDLLDGLKVVDRQGVMRTLQEMQDEIRDEPHSKRRRFSEDQGEQPTAEQDHQLEGQADDMQIKLEHSPGISPGISVSDNPLEPREVPKGAYPETPSTQMTATMHYRTRDPALQEQPVPQAVANSSGPLTFQPSTVTSGLPLDRRRLLSPGILRRSSEPDVLHRSTAAARMLDEAGSGPPSSASGSQLQGTLVNIAQEQSFSAVFGSEPSLLRADTGYDSPNETLSNLLSQNQQQGSQQGSGNPYQPWGTASTLPRGLRPPRQDRGMFPLGREGSQTVGLSDLESRQFQYPDLPAHLAQPLNSVSTQPFSRVYTDFCRQQRQSIAIGEPYRELSAKSHRDAGALLDRKLYQIAHPLDKWAVDVLNVFSNQFQGPAMVAYKYLMTVLMQWQISPTPENYARVPEWLRPSPTQLFVPHPAWIDYLPWPKVRDFIILRPELGQSEDFLVPFTTCVSVNWPHGTLKTIFEDNGYIMKAEFEAHIREISNWRVAPRFLKSFPHLAGFVTVDPDYDGYPL